VVSTPDTGYEKHPILGDIAFGELKETEVKSIFQAFTNLPSAKPPKRKLRVH
jgi:hypothetical protein